MTEKNPNLDCSHVWGVEFLLRMWEQRSDDWHCNSTVYCNSMSGYFPNTLADVGISKVKESITVSTVQNRYVG